MRLYSAVLETKGPFPAQAERLLWSLTQLAGVAREQVIFHVAGPADASRLAMIRSWGVEVVPVPAFEGHPWCNKLQQLQSIDEREFDDVVLLDCDTLVLAEPPSNLDAVAGKPVDFANPPMEALERIYGLAGLDVVAAQTDVDHQPTVRGNFNGGVYVIGRSVFDPLARSWTKWAHWCLDRKHLFAEKWMHIDQVAFAMAATAESIPVVDLGPRYNFPTHVPQSPSRDCSPAVIHYHRATDPQSLLRHVEGLVEVNQVIDAVNAELRSIDSFGFSLNEELH